MSKHSPGPWFVHCRLDETEGTLVMAPGEQDNFIVCGCDDELFPEINAANARLIAAAPDLLSELKRLSKAYVALMESGRDRIIQSGGNCDPVDVMEAGDPHLRDVRAVIAKAEGWS